MLVAKLCGLAVLAGLTIPAPGEPAIRARLRDVVMAQEAYYAKHGTYTTEIGALELPKQETGTRIVVAIIFAGGLGWTGSAQSTASLGKSCVIYVGDPENLPKLPSTKAQRQRPSEEGVPTCDE